MENKAVHKQQEIVTKEILPGILDKIAIERERKGSAETLLPYVEEVRGQAEKLGDISSVMLLLHEKFLLGHHVYMEEEAKGSKMNSAREARGLSIMGSSVKEMEGYLEKNDEDLNPTVKARTYRFLGRFCDIKGEYPESERYYMQGLSYFNRSTTLKERSNRLEILGFISTSKLAQEEESEGMYLAQRVLKDFDETAEGKWLKQNDYYTWAVWKSGVEMRTAEHILKSKSEKYANLAGNFLKDAESILKMPNGNTEIFELRLMELNNIKSSFKIETSSSSH
jgi:hypothetical protein